MVVLAGQYAKQKTQVRDLEPGYELPPAPPRRSSPQHRLSPGQIAALVEARKSGAQIKDLADQFGIHKSTVLAHLERAGVPGRRWPGKILTSQKVKDAAWLYESGLSLIEVGDMFGVDRRQVSRALKTVKVGIRSAGRRS